MRIRLPFALGALLLFLSTVSYPAGIYKPVFNVQTGRPDLITPLSSSTIQPGNNVTVTGNADGSVTVGATGGGSGGASSLGVNFNGVSITSPTAQINFVGAGVSVTANGSTATVTISGGSSGASALAVTTGTSAGFNNPVVSTLTAVISLDQSQFKASLPAGSTVFINANVSISSVAANITPTSTMTVVLADATSGAITVTLPTAIGISGKVYTVKRMNSGANAVTVATTSSQTIDGGLTAVLLQQYTSLDLVSDGANWQIE